MSDPQIPVVPVVPPAAPAPAVPPAVPVVPPPAPAVPDYQIAVDAAVSAAKAKVEADFAAEKLGAENLLKEKQAVALKAIADQKSSDELAAAKADQERAVRLEIALAAAVRDATQKVFDDRVKAAKNTLANSGKGDPGDVGIRGQMGDVGTNSAT